ncbi:GAF domain-containing protein [Haloarcula japonica]|uniref:PAS domain S-box protein n=1 Tax=Haloarcula japonica (strain ATCC 49778 / DSM 6131 / JCM 7785 / NBRC 101032 / NCIMB 13157 / TR-1) TaxID=1227453 RepID=M0LKB2_HALJT|nr:GAF domain-containing protein [Haloarcula japonica]EMA33488.1 PAS domain S-box protein [Haloarcula japonica DSM 6131]
MGNNRDRQPLEPLNEAQCLELLSSIQRLTGVGMWAHDVATEETWWSRQAKEVHGLDPNQEFAFGELVARYTDTDAEAVLGLFADAISDTEPFSVDVALTGAGTTERSIRLHCEPRQSADGKLRLYGTVRDITDVKRREQRIEVLRKTSQELRSVSSRQDVAEIIADAAKNILGLVNTTVRLVDTDDELLRTVVATEECLERAGDRPDYSVGEATPAARTFRTGEPELHADHELTEDDHNRGDLQSGLYVPIGEHGVLSAGDVVVDAFAEHDLEAAGLLGQLGAEAITRIGWVKRSRAV